MPFMIQYLRNLHEKVEAVDARTKVCVNPSVLTYSDREAGGALRAGITMGFLHRHPMGSITRPKIYCDCRTILRRYDERLNPLA